MIASPSSLILKDFAIINTNCEVIPFENNNIDFSTLQKTKSECLLRIKDK